MHSKKYPNFKGKRLQKSYSTFPYVSWLKTVMLFYVISYVVTFMFIALF